MLEPTEQELLDILGGRYSCPECGMTCPTMQEADNHKDWCKDDCFDCD